MYVSLWSRFTGYAIIGCLLLLIYQFVFMARTSASRDWNHLHSNFLPPVHVKRLLIQRTVVPDTLSPNSTVIDIPRQFSRIDYKLPEATVVKASVGDLSLNLSNFSGIFAFDANEKEEISIELPKLYVVHHDSSTNVTAAISAAESAGAQALLLVVSPNWVPNHGVSEYGIPIIASTTDLPAQSSGTRSPTLDLVVKSTKAQTVEDYGYEWNLKGHLADTVVVGDSKTDPLSSAIFWGVANAYYSLSSQHNWMPLRSVKFVSYPHFSAEHYTQKHKSWIKNKVLGYIGVGGPTGTTAASPALKHCVSRALRQFEEANLLNGTVIGDPRFNLGENVWPLEYMVPSFSANLNDPIITAKLLTLVLADLTQEPFLPFDLVATTKYISDPELADAAHELRQRIEDYHLLFTSEFPWYKWTPKIKALALRKRTNLGLRNLERCFQSKQETDYYRHLLFTSDPSWSQSVTRSLDKEQQADLVECINKKVVSSI